MIGKKELTLKETDLLEFAKKAEGELIRIVGSVPAEDFVEAVSVLSHIVLTKTYLSHYAANLGVRGQEYDEATSIAKGDEFARRTLRAMITEIRNG